MEFLSAVYRGASRGELAAFTFVGMIIVAVLSILSQRDGSYLRTQTPDEMTFGEPWALRAFMASLFGWIVFACASMVKPFPWLLVLVASGAVTIGTFRSLGSNQTVFDMQRHRYHSVKRWLWSPHVCGGNYDDLSGIFVRPIYLKGTTFYIVSLAWKNNSERPSRLGRFSKSERASAFASELSQTLGLPLVEPPLLKKTKHRFSIIQ